MWNVCEHAPHAGGQSSPGTRQPPLQHRSNSPWQMPQTSPSGMSHAHVVTKRAARTETDTPPAERRTATGAAEEAAADDDEEEEEEEDAGGGGGGGGGGGAAAAAAKDGGKPAAAASIRKQQCRQPRKAAARRRSLRWWRRRQAAVRSWSAARRAVHVCWTSSQRVRASFFERGNGRRGQVCERTPQGRLREVCVRTREARVMATKFDSRFHADFRGAHESRVTTHLLTLPCRTPVPLAVAVLAIIFFVSLGTVRACVLAVCVL